MQTSVRREQDILPFALVSARRYGDLTPILIQHATTTRQLAATALGWGTDDDRPVYLVVIKGQFFIKKTTYKEPFTSQVVPRPVLFRVIDIATAWIIDSGSRRAYPDLRDVKGVVTDLDADVGGEASCATHGRD